MHRYGQQVCAWKEELEEVLEAKKKRKQKETIIQKLNKIL